MCDSALDFFSREVISALLTGLLWHGCNKSLSHAHSPPRTAPFPLFCSYVRFVSSAELQRETPPGPVNPLTRLPFLPPSLTQPPAPLHPLSTPSQVRFVSLSELRQEFFTPETLPTQFRQ